MEPGSLVLQADSLLSEPLGEAPIPTVRDAMDYSPPGSSVHGILWARILMGKQNTECGEREWKKGLYLP